MRGFVVSVIGDACSDPKEALHRVLVEEVLPSGAHVVDAETFMAEWMKAREGA